MGAQDSSAVWGSGNSATATAVRGGTAAAYWNLVVPTIRGDGLSLGSALTYRCTVLRRLRFALRPGWLALHVLCVALIVTMVLLGRWQLRVSESKQFSLQNFGYAIQWWAFSIFVLVMWARVLRDTVRRNAQLAAPAEPEAERAADEPVAYRRYVIPTAPQAPVDAEHAAYNDYLARLAAKDADE
jgi:DNA-binding transcriptional regulator of glucitol operon